MAVTKYITLDSLGFFYEMLRSDKYAAAKTTYGAIKLGGDSVPSNQRGLQIDGSGNTYIELFPENKTTNNTIGSNIKPIYIDKGGFVESNASIGSSTAPIYMKGGELKAIDVTIGSADTPIWMKNGELKASDITIGSADTPIYMDGGVLKAATITIGTDITSEVKPIYMNKGVLKAATQNLGSGSTAGTTAQALYMLNGALKAIETTIGKKSQPVYLNKGKFEACDDMGVVIKQIQDELAALIDSSVKNIKFNQNFNRIEVTTEKSTTAEDGSVTKTDEVYITAALTKLEKPSKPTIATTEYTLVSGDASVAVKNEFKSTATLYYRIKNKTATSYGSWTSLGAVSSKSTKSFNIASGYSNSNNNAKVEKTVQVKAIFNGEESLEGHNTYNIVINPKVSAMPTISVVRSINDNNSYGTKLEVKVSPSATTGAKNEYSLSGGADGTWVEFTASNTVVFTETTTESTKETHTLNVKTRATKSNYAAADTASNTSSYTIGQEKAYCGANAISTLAGMSKAEILKLATKQSAANLSAGSYTITASSGNYMWYCCTTKHSDINSIVVMSAANPAPFGMNYMGQIGAWHCYRSTNSLLGNANFYHK